MLHITGPGHGGPGLVANTYLEGTYSEVYPNVSQDEEGLRRLFKQFSFPGGIPSHVAPETPGSHPMRVVSWAMRFRTPMAPPSTMPIFIVASVVGDGEAETGPLATSWHSNKFLNPVTDGAVLPLLHLNGYRIASPSVLARISHEELESLPRGYGHTPYFVEGSDAEKMHEYRRPRWIRSSRKSGVSKPRKARSLRGKRGNRGVQRPRSPMIVLRSPKGWTCPKEIDGKRCEDYWRSHQVPMGEMHENPARVRILEEWMKSYRPEELFDGSGKFKPELAALAPQGQASRERQSAYRQQ